MTREDQFIERLEGYLDEYEGHTPLPVVVRDAIRAELPTTRQVSPRSGPIGRLNMSLAMPTPARYGLLAAVVVAAAALGVAFLNGSENIGPPTPSPTPTPSPATLIEPDASGQDLIELPAGTYYVDDPFPVHVTFDLPEDASIFNYTSEASQVNVALLTGGEVSFEIIENVSADPCTGELLDPPVGPSVDDLVAALSNLAGWQISPVTDVTVDGYQGKAFTMTAPESAEQCDMRTWKTTTRHNGVGRGEINQVWIVDVDGVRLLISTADAAGTSSAVRLAQRAVVDSVQLGP